MTARRRPGVTAAAGTTTLNPPATPPFPGITSPRCHDCTWAWHGGCMQVKYVNRVCAVHSRAPEVSQPC